MPVDGGPVASKSVMDSDLDCVTPVAVNRGAWNLAVNCKSESRCAIVVVGHIGDCKVVLADGASVRPAGVLISLDVEVVAPLITTACRVASVVLEARAGDCVIRGGGGRRLDGQPLGGRRERWIDVGVDGAEDLAAPAAAGAISTA